MSAVLQFKPSTRSGTGKALPQQACEIVIFPGVRIERHAEPDLRSTADLPAKETPTRIEGLISRTN